MRKNKRRKSESALDKIWFLVWYLMLNDESFSVVIFMIPNMHLWKLRVWSSSQNFDAEIPTP
jgi:hypothetical protein